MKNITFGFIGLGLIGGSIAKALKHANKNCYIIAYDVDLHSLKLAKREGICDEIVTSVSSDFSKCDYIFLCTPVCCNNEYLSVLKNIIKESCIITDVGSVKKSIHKLVRDYHLESHFIGGHPMAGSEHSGYVSSNDRILENAYYILTPCKEVPKNKIDNFFQIIKEIGALPLILNEETHDFATAGISHLPHMIAFSLVNLIKQKDDADEIMKTIAAGGFKDITRVASSSPEMWQQILELNKDNIVHFMDSFLEEFTMLRKNVADDNFLYLYDYINQARAYRDSIDISSSGPINCSYSISISIPDETGMIAKISTLFANASINIKNIGIVHNREMNEGALRIEFYDKQALDNAIELLSQHQYLICTQI